MNFSWVPFYRELAGKVLEFEDKQDELLALDSRMKAEGVFPSEAPELRAIDPFTFFLRIGSSNSYQTQHNSYTFLKSQWSLQSEIPIGQEGLGDVESGALRFHHGDNERVIDDLWHLARQGYQGVESVDESLFDRCRKNCVPDGDRSGIYRLVVGLSWLNPEEFLPCLAFYSDYSEDDDDEYTESVDDERSPFRAYVDFLRETKRLNQKPFYELVFDKGNYSPYTPDLPNIPDPVGKKVTPRKPKIKPPIMQTSLKNPLNRILYGPPGTGKTFSSISKAVALLDGLVSPNRVECQARFHELRAQGRIEFVTFHQSFSYEEFIEGLRPILDDEDGQARYEIRDGIFKQIRRAAFENRIEKTIGGRPTFDELLKKFWERLPQRDWIIPGISDGTRKPRGNYHIREPKDEYIRAANIAGRKQSDYWVPIEVLRTCWAGLEKGAYPDSPTLRGIWGHGFQCNLGGAVCLQLQKIEEEVKPNSKTTVDWSSSPRFVLIIDEINRGNISKIFGELITLLEDDKRIGEANELRVTLPTSGEEFALPPNLYILGTMNTADRSLAQLDVALRRRFEFEELAPRPELCDKLPLLPEVLTRLNEHLEWALDREHRLGHAYFMDVDSPEVFNLRFQSKVVPLLIEYFPHDFETLRAVLGEKGKADGFLREFKAPDGFSGKTKYRWWFETNAKDGFSAFEQLKSNFGIS